LASDSAVNSVTSLQAERPTHYTTGHIPCSGVPFFSALSVQNNSEAPVGTRTLPGVKQQILFLRSSLSLNDMFY